MVRPLARLSHQGAVLPSVLTIGHSTRPIDEFIRLLTAHGVNRVLDTRTIPGSGHNPPFSRETLARCPPPGSPGSAAHLFTSDDCTNTSEHAGREGVAAGEW